MGKSFKEYVSALGYWGLIVIAPITLDILGVYQVVTNTQFLGVPSWSWFLLASILFLIIPFIAFHRVRVQRDEYSSRLGQKSFSILWVKAYFLHSKVLCGSVCFKPQLGRIMVESLWLDIGGEHATTNWETKTFYREEVDDAVVFDIPPNIHRGKRTVKLMAIVDGSEVLCDEFTLHLPPEESDPK